MGQLVSQSTVKAYKRCRKQFWYKHVELLEPRFPHERLKLGNWWHSLAAVHFAGVDWEEEQARQEKKFKRLFLEEREKLGDLPDKAKRLFLGHQQHWRKEQDEWEVLYVEESFDLNWMGHTVTFKPDLIVQTGKGKKKEIWVVDHKTTKSITDEEFRMSDLQSAIYVWALEMAGICSPTGFIWNYVRTKEPSIPSINLDGQISKRRIDTDFYTLGHFLLDYYQVEKLSQLPKNWKEQLNTLKTVPSKFYKRTRQIKDPYLTAHLISDFFSAVEEMDYYFAELEANPEINPEMIFTRNLQLSCQWDCDFQELCLGEMMGVDMSHMRKTRYKGSKYMKGRGRG